MSAGIIILIIVLVLAVILLARSITVIHQAQRGIVERFGRSKETLEPGLRFRLPQKGFWRRIVALFVTQAITVVAGRLQRDL